jgi:CheY-specific phosphatase CheX
MYHRYAEILGKHASDVFKSMSGLTPTKINVFPTGVFQKITYPLGVRVDFSGSSDLGHLVTGFFICAFDSFEAASEIAKSIAVHLGLEAQIAEQKEGVDNVVAEFLNIVIGLTCSDWAESGLRIDFNPPEKLVEHHIHPVSKEAMAFHLIIETSDSLKVSIFLNFMSDRKQS